MLRGWIIISKVLFILPEENMVEHAKAILKEQFSDIIVKKAVFQDITVLTKRFMDKGVEVVIARGGSATLIKQELNITVIELPITGFDIIKAVEKARRYGSKIAVVALSSMIEGIDYLASILKVQFTLHVFDHPKEVEEAVLKVFRDGADVVMGGVTTSLMAKKHNLPYVMLENGEEGILRVAREAKYVEHALQIEKAKKGTLSTILDYAYEGIVTINDDYVITGFNPVASKLSKVNATDAIGNKITKVLPSLKLDSVINKGLEDLHQLIQINDTKIMCNKVPIIVNGKSVGAVVTMQDITKIQQMEARIRKDLYNQGHVAKYTFENILGKSHQICQTIEYAKDFAKTSSNILIFGETGTGKEVFAQSIHNHSNRSSGPFLAINCAALPSQILESELFGYVGGAFTGANKEGKPGLFEVAHGGTVFLDEISEMDYSTQGRLLRVLQEKTVVRLGSNRVIPVDVRVIAATNKVLKRLVSENKFRDDLYHRLNVLRLILPPLRERKSDISIFSKNFLQEFAISANRKMKFSKSALKWLENYQWPGNVRELKNAIERIVAICKTETIEASKLSQICGDEYALTTDTTSDLTLEGKRILDAISAANGNISDAAKFLGVHRSTLWRKIQRLGLKV